MSIVAERPVVRAVGRGLAEEIERQEREDDARGPEPEGAGPNELGPELEVSARTGKRRGFRGDERERVGRLAGLHHRRVVLYLFVRVQDWQLAEDLAQEMWLDLAMRPHEMGDWAGREDADLFPLLAWRAKRQIHHYLRRRMNERESVLGAGPAGDGRGVEQRLDALAGPGSADEVHCAVEALLGLVDVEGFSECWARALGVLSPRQREAIELLCEGMTQRAIAARMSDSQGNVGTHLRAALRVLRDPAEIARRLAKQEAERLPEGWERFVGRLPAAQAEVVGLRAQGLSNPDVGRRLGRTTASVYDAYGRAVRALRRMAAQLVTDQAQEAPAAAKEPGSCARACASGCYLRTARPAVKG
ncbi:sigma-70 family RNA polymerase sigma factor [Streptomyces halstedii]|uniref:HTH luxR-type domain-containing protein n=1 Tax=Streptomyces halstedii TaxID=1944 RepID=A0A6N9TWK8_STRHA|nr:sigma-70 family RNA polymerase sigma factor [Streptomyces halstedii]NEA14263.1 hypothetical protein [Streptomyces halstedii]